MSKSKERNVAALPSFNFLKISSSVLFGAILVGQAGSPILAGPQEMEATFDAVICHIPGSTCMTCKSIKGQKALAPASSCVWQFTLQAHMLGWLWAASFFLLLKV